MPLRVYTENAGVKMTDIYNLTNYTNSNTYYEQFSAINNLSGSLLIYMIILVTFIILFTIIRKTQEIDNTFITSGLITSLVVIICWGAKLCPVTIVIVPIIITIFGIILKSTR